MGKVGDAFVEVSTKTTRFQKGMAGVRAALAKLGPALAVAAVAAAAFGAIALGRKAVQGVSLYSDAIEDAGKFTVVFGADADRVKKSIDEFAEATGRSSTELQALAGNTGDVIKALGIESSAAADLSVDLTKLAVDVASFKNASEPQVIKAFTSALTGERESLKTLGIVINEAQVKAEAFTSGIAKQGETLTSAQKAMATYQLLLSRTTDAQGDATKTAGSLQNIFRRVGAAFRDFQRVIGQVIVQGTGLKTLGKIAAAALNAMTSGLKKFAAGLNVGEAGRKFRSNIIETFRAAAKVAAVWFRILQAIFTVLAGIGKVIAFLSGGLLQIQGALAGFLNPADAAKIDAIFDKLQAANNRVTTAAVAGAAKRTAALRKEGAAAAAMAKATSLEARTVSATGAQARFQEIVFKAREEMAGKREADRAQAEKIAQRNRAERLKKLGDIFKRATTAEKQRDEEIKILLAIRDNRGNLVFSGP